MLLQTCSPASRQGHPKWGPAYSTRYLPLGPGRTWLHSEDPDTAARLPVAALPFNFQPGKTPHWCETFSLGIKNHLEPNGEQPAEARRLEPGARVQAGRLPGAEGPHGGRRGAWSCENGPGLPLHQTPATQGAARHPVPGTLPSGLPGTQGAQRLPTPSPTHLPGEGGDLTKQVPRQGRECNSTPQAHVPQRRPF